MVATSEPAELPGRPPSEHAVGAEQQRHAGPLAALQQRHAALVARYRWYGLLAEIVAAIQAQQPDMLAKQAAYSLLYAVPSIVIMMISLAAIVDRNTGYGISDALRTFIANEAPQEVQALLDSLVQYALVRTSTNTALMAVMISLAIAVWGAAGGVGSLSYAINQVYDVRESRPFFKGLAINVGMTVLGGIMVIAAFVLLAFGRLLLDRLPWVAAEGGLLATVLSSSPLLALLLFFCSLLMLYWLALAMPKSLRWLLPGALLATLATGVLLAVIDLILTYSNPGAAYGVAGAVLILLWTLYVMSVFVIVGAIVNAVLGRHFDRTLRAALRERPYEAASGKRIEVSEYR